MPTTGDVELTILDNGGAVVVPSASVMLAIGCCSGGTAGQVVASRNINSLISTIGYGTLTELCGKIISRGGTVLAVKTPSNTAGALSAVASTAAGSTSVVTVTGTPYDTYYVRVKCTKTGTIAAAGPQFQISLDAGRTYGPVISLGSAVTYVIPNTGITLNFAAGHLDVGATYTFKATEPLWNTAGVQAAIAAFQATQYAMIGVGGTIVAGDATGADASTINGYLDTLAGQKVFTRALTNIRDASPPSAYAGTGETEAAWTTAINTSVSGVDAKRVLVGAGHYNMPSVIPNSAAGTPRYRRPYTWALACRQVQIPPQRHAGRVKDGALLDVVIDPTVDPSDGFVYHDERLNPGLKASRFAVAKTRIKKTGYYADDPFLMAATGSVFELLPLGIVMDIACGIVTDVGQTDINEDIRLNKNGTIFENEARSVESRMLRALTANMFNANMISGASVAVDRGNNVRSTKTVNVNVSIESRGYVLQENITIGYADSAAA